ncbi:ImmA/IrrE family metallo-endopeptidase [Paenibacillus alvei]|uniref:ImmA/IrrE family metallo-endopeptidase n=1 Tax=Paenibacillus alvei TaxID=44250 RepID=UPI002DBAAE40|nr:ImmA/IrrE family metallo-endopeptidase [Paenibacillus alvei]
MRFEDLGDSTFGMYYTKFRQRYIVINNKISEEWQRVVCAHELGHDLLHFGVNRFFVDSHTFFLSAKQERQANIFAVQLLTANDTIYDGESVFNYFCRIKIPDEMVSYYKGVS